MKATRLGKKYYLELSLTDAQRLYTLMQMNVTVPKALHDSLPEHFPYENVQAFMADVVKSFLRFPLITSQPNAVTTKFGVVR